MSRLCLFTTDWSEERVLDETRTRLAGREVFVPGKKKLSYGGTSYTRLFMPGMELAKHDWDVSLSWRFEQAPDGHLRFMDTNGDWQDPDVAVTQRWMARDADIQMERARSTGQIVVSDLDDDFWSLSKTNLAYETTSPERNSEFNRDHYWKMLGACSAITVSTEALRKRVERLGVPTFVVRNAIDLERWPQNDPGSAGYISWIGGIQWRSHDLEQLKCNDFGDFLAFHSLPCYHGGHSEVPGVPPFWAKAGIDPKVTQVAIAPLCHIAEYPNLWGPVNVSLIPLEQVAFNQAKSNLKSLESCAAGVPYIVSSGFSEQQILIDEGSAGRVARNTKPSDWWGHWEDLLDPDVRRKEGAINRTIAERHDIRDRWIDWDSAYREIMAL